MSLPDPSHLFATRQLPNLPSFSGKAIMADFLRYLKLLPNNFVHSWMDGHRQTDRWTDGLMNRQTAMNVCPPCSLHRWAQKPHNTVCVSSRPKVIFKETKRLYQFFRVSTRHKANISCTEPGCHKWNWTTKQSLIGT